MSAETSTEQQSRALLWLLAIITIAFLWILLPFFGTIMWSAIIALLFAPVQRRLIARTHLRSVPAALVTLLIALLVVILPIALLAGALTREALLLYEGVQSGELNPEMFLQRMFSALPSWLTTLLDRFGLVDLVAIKRRIVAALTQGSQFIAVQTVSIGQNTFDLVASLFLTLYLAYFFIRDGEPLVRKIRHTIPLAADHKRELFEKLGAVIRATVKGTLLVAATQGALGGLAFWVLGVRAALLWGVLMAVASLLPVIGAALVWLPVAIYLLISGSIWKSVALIAYGVLVIGLIDNVLRPILVGREIRMPDYVVLMATLGGIAVFGINGIVVGPAIAATFIAAWHIYRTPSVDTAQGQRTNRVV